MTEIHTVVGRNVAALRHERRLSASELARTAGISKATVLALEVGRANPTITTLQTLSTALGVEVTDLITEGPCKPSATVHRADDPDWHPLGNLLIRPLTTIYGSALVYVFHARIGEDGYREDGHEPNAIESLFVLDGTIEAGPQETPVIVEPGDFIRFTADVPHIYRAITGEARALIVIGRNRIPDVGGLPPHPGDAGAGAAAR